MIAQLLDPARLASGAIAETHMRTLDNAANLDQATVDDLLATYGGSTLGRQELEGELIFDLSGTLVNAEMIERGRMDPSDFVDDESLH